MGKHPAVDPANGDPQVVERRAVAAAAGGRQQTDGGVFVLVEPAVVVEVLQRARVRPVVDRRSERDRIRLAGQTFDFLAVALIVDVGIVDGEVVLAQIEHASVGAGLRGGPEDVP